MGRRFKSHCEHKEKFEIMENQSSWFWIFNDEVWRKNTVESKWVSVATINRTTFDIEWRTVDEAMKTTPALRAMVRRNVQAGNEGMVC